MWIILLWGERYHPLHPRYINLIRAVEEAKQGLTMAKDTVAAVMFARGFCRGDIRNTRRVAEAKREGARLH